MTKQNVFIQLHRHDF